MYTFQESWICVFLKTRIVFPARYESYFEMHATWTRCNIELHNRASNLKTRGWKAACWRWIKCVICVRFWQPWVGTQTTTLSRNSITTQDCVRLHQVLGSTQPFIQLYKPCHLTTNLQSVNQVYQHQNIPQGLAVQVSLLSQFNAMSVVPFVLSET